MFTITKYKNGSFFSKLAAKKKSESYKLGQREYLTKTNQFMLFFGIMHKLVPRRLKRGKKLLIK